VKSFPMHEQSRWRRAIGCVSMLLVLGFSLLAVCPAMQAQCSSLRSGERIWVRLLGSLASYSAKAGNKIEAMVIESPKCEGEGAIPAGSIITGDVTSVRKVGMGFLHETARMQVEFRSLQLKDGTEIAITSRLLEIDNAREKVKDGTIHGVNATDTPQGRITNRLKHLPTWNPYSDLALVAYRSAFPFFPEPEIYLPRGSDLKLELTAEVTLPANLEPESAQNTPDEIERAVLEITAPDLPQRTTTRHGQDADLVNVVLLGSEEQMDSAFRAAGWTNGDQMSTRSVLRQTRAFLSFQNYPSAPITTQLVDGQRVSSTWEKGLDSYAKREHLRVWGRKDVIEGQTVWLGAMTRETGAVLSLRQHKFIHHIDTEMDEGREILARDLGLAGCVTAAYYVQRPQMLHAAMNATGDPMRTDGSLAVVQLKDCENPVFEQASDAPAVQSRPRSKFARFLRMQILSFKSDLIRGNFVYGAFDLTRMAVRARRHSAEQAALARQVQTERALRAPVDVKALNAEVDSFYSDDN
jgi:LssY-like putative type I secretion system component LssY